MSTIKAIETEYKGHRMRSRLEARWAVFFDHLKADWVYETEGYELSNGQRYLPDFYLPEYKTWIEIKPKGFDSDTERLKYAQFVKEKGDCLLLICGLPSVNLYDWRSDNPNTSPDGMCELFVGTFVNSFSRDLDWAITHHFDSLEMFLDEKGYDHVKWDGGINSAWSMIEADKRYYMDKYKREHPHWQFGIHEGSQVLNCLHDWLRLQIYCEMTSYSGEFAEAVKTARSARFEHGEMAT